MEYLIGVDIGTHESKGTMVDRDGRIAASAAVPHGTSIPAPGRAEHDAEGVWWHDFLTLTRELLEASGVPPTRIAAVGCSGIGPCVLPVDRSGSPLRPAILYGIDTRAVSQVRELTERLGADWIARETGSALSSQAGGPKILWIRQEEPEVWRRTERIMTCTSYLVYRLTGRVVIDHYTAAAYGPLYNLHDRGWDSRAVELVCDAQQLPELAWSGEVAGTVTPEASRLTGLMEGTPVVAGTADAASEAIAAGVLEPGDTMLMYGSSMFFIQVCASLPASAELWPTVYLEPDSFALAAGMSTAGSLTQWFRDNFAGGELRAEADGGESAYQVLAGQAGQIHPGAEGLLVLPYLSGERTPLNDPLARGTVAGLTLYHTRAHIYRALLEGIAYGIRQNLESMADAGADPARLVAVGGGVRNSLWVQIVSDVTARDQLVRATPGASYGDAALAAVGAGLLPGPKAAGKWLDAGTAVTPDPVATETYERGYRLFRRLYSETRDVTHELAAGGAEESQR